MNWTKKAEKYLDELAVSYPPLAPLRESVAAAAQLICECHLGGHKVLLCGNGGSASDSEHIVGELMKGFVLPRRVSPRDALHLEEAFGQAGGELAGHLQRGIAAVALTGHAALSTAIQNDTAAEVVFAQQVYVLGRPGDLLIGLSTSGNSRNVVNALQVARAFGLKTIGLTGSRPAHMDALCDVILKAPASETFKIQEYHLPIYHVLCLMVEEQLFGTGDDAG